ncbi:baculoviral IAP repeat-containing protein 7-B isoform X2 [Leptidea sinapis]|uniref:baculoviral IAP repeat-containing protein 7-B isoform X2 n=1 Tax=Leptidea sinapis TaxID=189913 RepID=UPI0021C3214B|nr:baculoviral IAP repeat-containing protein 7-B isoform X2 [Leptidea sinapis]
MNIERNRINTFANWPSSAPVDSDRLARAGFFYTGNGTEAECFCCGGKISDWNFGDQVMWRHRVLEPNCLMVLSPELSGNIPATSHSTPPIPGERSYSEDEGYGIIAEDQLYRSNSLRLLSFINWNDPISRESLVYAGFYHAGEGRLRCAWCGGEFQSFRNVRNMGTPLEIHRAYFPRCRFAMEVERRDRSHRSPFHAVTTSQATSNDNSSQVSAADHNEQVVAAGAMQNLGMIYGCAKHPSKAKLSARLSTFNQWPFEPSQAPESLAEAGFFYTGVEDQVRCFYCDGGLGKWESGDIPWIEHARKFPQCGFVLTTKGTEFVETALETIPDSTPANRNNSRGCRSNTSRRGQQFLVDENVNSRGSRSNTSRGGHQYHVDENVVDTCMEGAHALAALRAGLDAARVRRAIVKRLQSTGVPFLSSESLIDTVLNDQLNEEDWSIPAHENMYLDRLFEACEPRPGQSIQVYNAAANDKKVVQKPKNSNKEIEKREVVIADKQGVSLEEENRQLKEARLCKVCMDNEVSMVFLPCGHLVSCAVCSVALVACPLCRAAVKARVRAYFA